MTMKSKIKILDTCTLPVLTCGVQTWSITKSQIKKKRVTHKEMERNILNVKKREKISNIVIRKKTKAIDIWYKIKKLKYKYVGHLART